MQYEPEKHEAVFACFINASFSIASIFFLLLGQLFPSIKEEATGMFVIIVCLRFFGRSHVLLN